MSASPTYSRIDEVAPGDIVALDRGAGELAYKVVHREPVDSGILITFEADDGETFQLEMAADTSVKRSLESKWESTQSPTAHSRTPD